VRIKAEIERQAKRRIPVIAGRKKSVRQSVLNVEGLA
jgi:hypothetical protein